MNSKAIGIVVAAWLIIVAQFCWASANNQDNITQKNADLQIYLPREITVKDDTISLGRVSIIRGKESLVAKANTLALGRISSPGQEIIIDRTTLLSRLACNGISASQVTLTGAEKMRIKRQQKIIKGSEFVEAALAFLKENLPAGAVCLPEPVRVPADLVITGTRNNIKLSPYLVKNAARNQLKVQVAVLADGEKIAAPEITFRLKYNCHKVVTLVELAAGAVISPENVKIEKDLSNYPEPAGWKPPYGLVVRRRLPANSVIRPGLLQPVKPAVIVGRNQSVIIRIERPGLLVTAVGKTMQDGRAGQYIRVRNTDSQRIILAKVKENGTVEPVF